MTVEKIRNEVNKFENDINGLLSSLKEIRFNIIEQLKPFINSSIKNMVENEVRSNSEHTKSLGKEQLGQMKSKLNQILENCDQSVENLFADDKYWVYQNLEDLIKCEKYGVSSCEKKAWEELSIGIKKLYGLAGELLQLYKYIKIDDSYAGRVNSCEWKKGHDNKIIYAYGISTYSNKNLENLIKQYKEKIESLYTLSHELGECRIKLSEQEAVDLWEEL
jgi:hypothetical protein